MRKKIALLFIKENLILAEQTNSCFPLEVYTKQWWPFWQCELIHCRVNHVFFQTAALPETVKPPWCCWTAASQEQGDECLQLWPGSDSRVTSHSKGLCWLFLHTSHHQQHQVVFLFICFLRGNWVELRIDLQTNLISDSPACPLCHESLAQTGSLVQLLARSVAKVPTVVWRSWSFKIIHFPAQKGGQKVLLKHHC